MQSETTGYFAGGCFSPGRGRLNQGLLQGTQQKLTFFFLIEILLIYNVAFQVYSKVIQLYTHTHTFFFGLFSIIGYYRYWVEFPVLDSRSFCLFFFFKDDLRWKKILSWLIYNVLSISAVQQSDPIIHIHTFFFSYVSSVYLVHLKLLIYLVTFLLSQDLPGPLIWEMGVLWVPLSQAGLPCDSRGMTAPSQA